MDSNYSLADVATVMGRDSGFGGAGGLGWLIILFLFFMGRGFGFGGGSAEGYVTPTDLSSALQAQTSALNQQSIMLSSANNNYETARLIDQLGATLMTQNNTNTINQIQAYNALTSQITNQTNVLASKLDTLGFNLEQCCCRLSSQLKDNQISELTNQLNLAQNKAVNADQSLFLLSQLGKFTPTTGGTT